MAYDRVWDETFPPDSQQANQLGLDIRNFKTDVRERIASFGADVLANRPTPEASFAGVTYFATDTGQIFRWTGAAWTDITTDFITTQALAKTFAVSTITGNTTGNVVGGVGGETVITAGSLGVNGGFKLEAYLRMTVNNGVAGTIRTRMVRSSDGAFFDGTTIGYPGITGPGWLHYQSIVGNRGAANSQIITERLEAYANNGAQVFIIQTGTQNLDTSVNDFTTFIVLQHGSLGDSTEVELVTINRI